MKILLLVTAALVCSVPLKAQSSSTPIGARAQSLGNASSCLSDEWSLLNNVAGLAKLSTTTATCTYHAVPVLASFNRTAAALTIPLRTGVMAAGIFRFGDDLYNESFVSLGYANTFGLASLGLKVSCVQYRAQGFGSKQLLTAAFGGIARLTPLLAIGAHIDNILQPALGDYDDDRLPARLTAGVTLTPSPKVILTSELSKDVYNDATWRTGLEYTFTQKFIFRTGFNVHPNAGFIGFGFRFNKIKLDYALSLAHVAASSHQASVVYILHKSKS